MTGKGCFIHEYNSEYVILINVADVMVINEIIDQAAGKQMENDHGGRFNL